ncbi:MAG: response regulator transcription factor, partial [Chloroflexi bacterium]|nr:response regulator transcription factor [Chloroflexota bacterium]
MAYSVAFCSREDDADASLLRTLRDEGIAYAAVAGPESLSLDYDAALVDLSVSPQEALAPLAERCKELSLPLICAISQVQLSRYDYRWGATDFILLPARPGEISARLRQATRKSNPQGDEKVVRAGELRIDLERYEVFNHGSRVNLTFKEYQLLCLLASSPGHVFSRESLLNQIWEYDYFGGTRTVDVHIRRLRSKIEDSGQTYIETVWNVG